MPDFSLNPVYLSARAAIVAPERAIPTSIYSVQKWLPRLGPERWCLIMLLRALCVDAPRRPDGTKQIICSLQELGEALNLDKRTLHRWFEHEPIPNDDPWRKIVPTDDKTKYLTLFIPRQSQTDWFSVGNSHGRPCCSRRRNQIETSSGNVTASTRRNAPQWLC